MKDLLMVLEDLLDPLLATRPRTPIPDALDNRISEATRAWDEAHPEVAEALEFAHRLRAIGRYRALEDSWVLRDLERLKAKLRRPG